MGFLFLSPHHCLRRDVKDPMEPLTPNSSQAQQRTTQRRPFLPILALIGAGLLWGGSFAAMRMAVGVLNPWSVMWLRMTMAALVILPLTARTLFKGYVKGDWKRLIPMVLFQPCLYFLLESYALKYTTSSQAGIISALVPLFVAVGAWAFLKEHLHRHVVLGLLITIAGVSGLTLLEGPGGKAENPLLGNGLELLAMVSASINLLTVKHLSQRFSPISLTAMQIAAGTLFFSPGIYFLMQTGAGVWNSELIFAMIFLGLIVTLCAFGLYNWGMSHVPASKASIFINLVPVNAVLIGWVALGESLSPAQLLMATLVIGGVIFSQRISK